MIKMATKLLESFYLYFFSWTGVRDDLVIFMDIEVDDVNLCALQCELRITEQLLSSLGLTAHRCGSMKQCNQVLGEYCPETIRTFSEEDENLNVNV